MNSILKNQMAVMVILALTLSLEPIYLTAQTNKFSSTMKDIVIKTPAFVANGMIPSKYTCDGENISPALEWSAVPEGTNSIVLIMDDPDAPNGDWVHFILFNIPPESRFKQCRKTGLPRAMPSFGNTQVLLQTLCH